MNTISCRCRSFNRSYDGVVISILKFDTHLVVGSAVTAGEVVANHRLATAYEISYTFVEFNNEFKNEDQEFHDFHNVFNAQIQAVAKKEKRKMYEYYWKRIRTLSPHSYTHK